MSDLLNGKNRISETDLIAENILRPQSFKDYIGQPKLIERLGIAIPASQQRGDPCPSMLLQSPPGMGKTSLANVIAHECKTKYRYINSTAIRQTTDIIQVLAQLEPNEVVFLDEIHALNRVCAEILYPVLEDGFASLKLGNKEVVSIKIEPFCLIGATNMSGRIPQALRDRFEIIHSFEEYSLEELSAIVAANAHRLKLHVVEDEAVNIIARRSRGIPRISVRLLRRVRDFAQLNANMNLTVKVVEDSMNIEGIDENGFTNADKNYLIKIFTSFAGGPVGLEAISSAISEDRKTVGEYIEPFLIKSGFLARMPRGRQLTSLGTSYVIQQMRSMK